MFTCSLSHYPSRSSLSDGPAGGLTSLELRWQNRRFQGTGGVSAENRSLGFAPAFLDTATDRIYRACFADGRPAPMHLLEGLPPAVVAARDAAGRVIALKPTVLAGFVREDRFYTREQAAAQVQH